MHLLCEIWNSRQAIKQNERFHFTYFTYVNWISLYISTFENVFRSAVCREESITIQSTEKGQLSHGSQTFKFSLITVNEAHPPHNTCADITPAWCYRSIWLQDRKLDSFIGAVYFLSQSMPNVDEGMMYFKWLIMAGEAKRLDENPILPHNHQRQVEIRLTLTQRDVVTKPQVIKCQAVIAPQMLCGGNLKHKNLNAENVKLQTTLGAKHQIHQILFFHLKLKCPQWEKI